MKMIKTELYFGLDIPGCGEVTQEEFENFLRTEVDPRFAGYTVMQAQGMWKGTAESSVVLVIIHDDEWNLFERIGLIRKAYCELYSQESVMRVSTRVGVDF